MASITGFGGAFVRAKDPDALYAWYERHLGLTRVDGVVAFEASTQKAAIAFTFFGEGDDYFPLAQKAMIDFQVDDLDAILDHLQAEGIAVDPNRESYEFGKFGWFTDPEGNRVELWQPVTGE